MRINIKTFFFTRRIVTAWNNQLNYVINTNSIDDFKKNCYLKMGIGIKSQRTTQTS